MLYSYRMTWIIFFQTKMIEEAFKNQNFKIVGKRISQFTSADIFDTLPSWDFVRAEWLQISENHKRYFD